MRDLGIFMPNEHVYLTVVIEHHGKEIKLRLSCLSLQTASAARVIEIVIILSLQ